MRKITFFQDPTFIITGGSGKFEKGRSLRSTGRDRTQTKPVQILYKNCEKNGPLQDPNIVTERDGILRKERGVS
jgi:hypothetical protein